MLTGLLYFLFFLSALFLILIVLVQEGQGGGLGGAFGGAGAQTFGVRAGGITRVTFVLFAVFLGSALLINLLGGDSTSGSVLEEDLRSAPAGASAPAVPGGQPGQPAPGTPTPVPGGGN